MLYSSHLSINVFFYDIGYYHVYSSNVSRFNAFAELS